jgi:hypothetical protein
MKDDAAMNVNDLMKRNAQTHRPKANASRIWETPPYNNSVEFAKFVRVPHKEPTAPQDPTYYAVMSRVYEDALKVHQQETTSPEFQRQLEEMKQLEILLQPGSSQRKQVTKNAKNAMIDRPLT